MDPDRRDPQKVDRREGLLLRRDAGRRATDKLTCPTCGDARSRVTDSRPTVRLDGIFRRRECVACGKRFTTEEKVRPNRRSKKSASA